MELMQKYAKDDGAIGIEDLERWPSTSDAIGFLSMTTSASSVNELLQVSNTSLENCRLMPLASTTETSLGEGGS
jgi:hypothetical protein